MKLETYFFEIFSFVFSLNIYYGLFYFWIIAIRWPQISTQLKFIYSEKGAKFCKIFTLLLSYVVPVKSKVKISQSFVAFSEYMNFIVKQKFFHFLRLTASVTIWHFFFAFCFLMSKAAWLTSRGVIAGFFGVRQSLYEDV